MPISLSKTILAGVFLAFILLLSCTRQMDERQRLTHLRAMDQSVVQLFQTISNKNSTVAMKLFLQADNAPLPFGAISDNVFDFNAHTGVYQLNACNSHFTRVADSDSIILTMIPEEENLENIQWVISRYQESPTIFGSFFPEITEYGLFVDGRKVAHLSLQTQFYEGVPTQMTLEGSLEDVSFSAKMSSRLRRRGPSRFKLNLNINQGDRSVMKAEIQTRVRITDGNQPVHEQLKARFEVFPVKGKMRNFPGRLNADGPDHLAEQMKHIHMELFGVNGGRMGQLIPSLHPTANLPDYVLISPGMDSLRLSETMLVFNIFRDIKLPNDFRSDFDL